MAAYYVRNVLGWSNLQAILDMCIVGVLVYDFFQIKFMDGYDIVIMLYCSRWVVEVEWVLSQQRVV